MQHLNDIGFIFKPHGDPQSWESRIEGLKQYKEMHGHLRMSRTDNKTRTFMSKCRALYKERLEGKQNSLTDERVAQLEELGFAFQAGKTPQFRDVKRSWDERFQELL